MSEASSERQTFPVSSDDHQNLTRLLAQCEEDPFNPYLAIDAAELALKIGDFVAAEAMIAKWRSRPDAPLRLLNVLGLMYLRTHRAAEAIDLFSELIAIDPQDVGVRYNKAYALVLASRYEEALEYLDPGVARAVPAAASLRIKALHHLRRLDEAAEYARSLGDGLDSATAGAATLVAIDQGDWNTVKAFSARGAEHPDIATGTGYLLLDDGKAEAATDVFERVTQLAPASGRAWLGLGLSRLLNKEFAAAAEALTRGAGLLDTHLGAWLAAAWAYVLSENLPRARDLTDLVLQKDPRFAEGQGLSGYLELLAGNLDKAKRQLEVALRLDKKCFSAVLGRITLLRLEEKSDRADALTSNALQYNLNGETLIQAVSRLVRLSTTRPHTAS